MRVLTVAASSADEALEIFRHVHVDLLFTDIVMPGMDGLALAAEVRRISPATRILCTTGFASVLQTKRATQCEALLRKPYLPQQLEGEVDRLLRAGGAAP